MSGPSSTSRNFMSIEAAAEYLCVHHRTIRRYIADGKLPAYRVGGTLVRVQMADVEALIVRIPAAEVAYQIPQKYRKDDNDGDS